MPYRDIRPEYPPGALPAFVAPALLSEDEPGFRDAFEWLMAALGVATILLVAVCLRGLDASRARTVAALAFVAAFPLLLGSVVLTRFDLYPAALVAGRAGRAPARPRPARLRAPRRRRRGEALPGGARPRRARLRLAPPRPGEALVCLATLRRRSSRSPSSRSC